MNLQKLNLVELNAQEMKETEGGFLPLVIAAIEIVGALYGAGYAIGYATKH